MRAQPVQGVLEYDLGNFATKPGEYDFVQADRQIRAQMENIAPGTMVRLRVRRFKPVPGYIPCRRPDILLQIISEDAEALNAWHTIFQTEAALDY